METQTSCALERVLTDVPALTMEELNQVEKAIRQAKSHLIFSDDPREAVGRALYEAGVINEWKRPWLHPHLDFEPVPIQGKPISETIQEERV